MKKIKYCSLLYFLIILTGASFESCNKNSGSDVSGCNDPEAFNYKQSATSNNGTCIYASDKLAGTWNVTEYESRLDSTITYTATVTKIDNKTIHIKSNSNYPSPSPAYHADNMDMQIIWSTKKFVPNGNLGGSITDINSKWVISYDDDIGGTVYKVKQTYTK